MPLLFPTYMLKSLAIALIQFFMFCILHSGAIIGNSHKIFSLERGYKSKLCNLYFTKENED